MEEIYDFIKRTISVDLDKRLPIIYKGQISHDITKVFANMTEVRLKNRNLDNSVKRKVFHVTVEFLQNITKHSDDYDDESNPVGNGMFMLGEFDNAYYIITGNVIKEEKIEILRTRIDQLNNLSLEELKSRFKKQMKEGQIDKKGGAGLGMIDILRKTESRILYEFIPVTGKTHMFVNALKIPMNPSS